MSISLKIDNDNLKCFVICEKNLVLKEDGDFPLSGEIKNLCDEKYIRDRFFEENNNLCVVSLEDEAKLNFGYKFKYLRELFYEESKETVFCASRAKALIEWRKNTVFCPKCGSELVDSKTETARECPKCKSLHFPKIEPCVIMRITNGDKLLLAKHVNRNQNFYACIAGFVEAGESLEEACKREVFEETGLKIKNIRYCGSQSWPFPYQLMMGFSAEYDEGEIRLQEEELSDAKWFPKDELPITPSPGSIAYKLIHFEI